MKKSQKIVENIKESRNSGNNTAIHRLFVHEYHPPFGAAFSVSAHTKQFKIGIKHQVYLRKEEIITRNPEVKILLI